MGAPGQYSASPVIARDYLYLVSDRGTLTVIKAGDAFEVVHQTKLGIPVSGTPALDGVTIYIRTREGLLAFR